MDELDDGPGVLMSDALKGQIAGFSPDDVNRLQHQYIHVVVDRCVLGKSFPLVGLLQSALFDVEPEVEAKVEVVEALRTVNHRETIVVNQVELQLGDEEDEKLPSTVRMIGPFTIKAARIQEINPLNQTCVLALQLQRSKSS